jgi:hypothetical protein
LNALWSAKSTEGGFLVGQKVPTDGRDYSHFGSSELGERIYLGLKINRLKSFPLKVSGLVHGLLHISALGLKELLDNVKGVDK